ncbi:MAG: IBR domain-containing protein [Oscillospiraceae bacterium]|nr:IBR domain-containing protein [Oscillospiraceae bacterium]
MSELLNYKCPNCDGAIMFDSGTQTMKCPHCDTEIDVESLREYERDLETADDSLGWETRGERWGDAESGGVSQYVCEMCGGEIITDATTAATSCPYCDNPVIMKKQFEGGLRPDWVIPFKFDREAAKDAFAKHLNGKKLLPKVFRRENHVDEIRGLYVPFWLYSADADANIRYRATRVRHWSDSRFSYTETSTYRVSRAGSLAFDRVPADGSEKMPNDLMDSIEPFDYSKLTDFRTAYLAGYLADKYDVDSETASAHVNERIRRSTEDVFRGTVHGYASVTTEFSTINLRNGTVSYALLPVWILNTTWRGRRFIFAMNGQSGKFVGNLPVDKGAFCAWLFGLFAGIGAAASGLGLLLRHFGVIG